MKYTIKFLGFSLLAGYSLFGNAELDPMEVSALRLETETGNLPAVVQVIDQADIEKSGAGDLVGLLRKQANLQVRSTSGNSARSTVSMEDLERMEDCVPWFFWMVIGSTPSICLQSTGTPYPWHLSSRRGDSRWTVRTYGNHAVGGVIKINTKLPEVEPTGSLHASVGRFDSSNVRGAYSQRIGEIGFTIFGDRVESDGYRVNGDHQTEAGGFRMDWGGKSDWKGYLSWAVSDSEYGLPGSLNSFQLQIDRRQTLSPDDQVGERSSYGRAGLRYEINANWSFENRLGYQDRDVGADMPSLSYLANTNYETFNYGPALHLNSNAVDLVFGLDFSKDELDAKTNYGDSSFDRTTSALYSSVGLPISDLWKFNGNLRVEKAENSGMASGTQLNQINKKEWAGGLGLIRNLVLKSGLWNNPPFLPACGNR